MLLFIDTETNGMVNWKVKDKLAFQPDIVQLAAVLEDDAGRVVGALSYIIAEVDLKDTTRYHGITQKMVADYGIPLHLALHQLGLLMARAERIIAHNISFDEIVVKSAFIKAERDLYQLYDDEDENGVWPELYCTKDGSSPILDLPPTERMIKAGYNKPKPPTLGEAYKFFTGKDLEDAHDALADVNACRAVYHGIQSRSSQ